MKSQEIILVNKKISLNLLSGSFPLPKKIHTQINKYWKDLLQSGKTYSRGKVFSVVDIKEKNKEIEINFASTYYAHYLYSRNVGLPKKYACKNVHTSCLIETADNILIFGRMGSATSGAGRIQCVGGGLDDEDVLENEINLRHNIEKELQEEVGIDSKNENVVDSLVHKYIKHSQKINSIAMIFILKIKITAKQFKKHYAKFERDLKRKKLSPEFGELIYLPKEKKSINNFLQNEKMNLVDHYMEALLMEVC